MKVRCGAELDGQVFDDAKALLETEERIVRGAARARVPFGGVQQVAQGRRAARPLGPSPTTL
jgi:hypothetical protein